MSAIRTITLGIPNNWRIPQWENNVFYPRGSHVRVDIVSSGSTYADIYFAHRDVPVGQVAPQNDLGHNYWTLVESGQDHINYDSDINLLYEADSDIRLRLDSDFHYLRSKDSEHDSDIRALRDRDSEHDSDIRALRDRDSELDSDIQYLYRNTMKLRGFVDFAARGPKDHKPKWGDVYIAYVSGTARIEWAGIAGTTIEPGQVVVYDDSEWRVVGGGSVRDSEHIRNIRSLYEQYTQTNTDLEQRMIKRGNDSRSVFFEYDSDKSVLLFHDDGLDGPCLMDGANAPLGTVTTTQNASAGELNRTTATGVYNTISGSPNGWVYVGITLLIIDNGVVVHNNTYFAEPTSVNVGGKIYAKGTTSTTEQILYRENSSVIGTAFASSMSVTGTSAATDVNFSTSQFGPRTEMTLVFQPVDNLPSNVSILDHASGTAAGNTISNLIGTDSEDQRLKLRISITGRGVFAKGDKIIATNNASGHKSVLEYDGKSAWRKWSLVNFFVSDLDSEIHDRKAADSDIHDLLDSEYRARKDADSDLHIRVDSEIHDRKAADSEIFQHYQTIDLSRVSAVRTKTPLGASTINYNSTIGTTTVTGDGNGWIWLATNGILYILQDGKVLNRSLHVSEPASLNLVFGSGESWTYTPDNTTAYTAQYQIDGVNNSTATIKGVNINAVSHRYISYLNDSEKNLKQFAKNVNDNILKLVDDYQNVDSDIKATIASLHADASHIETVADVYAYGQTSNVIQRKFYFSEKTNTLFFEIDSDKYYSVKAASDVIHTNLLEVTSNARQLFVSFNGFRNNASGTLVYVSPRDVNFFAIISGASGTISQNYIRNFVITDIEKQAAHLILDSEPSLGDTIVYIDSDSGLKSLFELRKDYRQSVPTYVWRRVDEIPNLDSDIHRLYENDSELYKIKSRKYYNFVDSEKLFTHTGTYGGTMTVINGILRSVSDNDYDIYENGSIIGGGLASEALFRIRNINGSEKLVFRTTDGTKRLIAVGKFHNSFNLFVGVPFESYSMQYVGDNADVLDWLYQRSIRHDSEIIHHYNGFKTPQTRYYSEKYIVPVFTGTARVSLYSTSTPTSVTNMKGSWVWSSLRSYLVISDENGAIVYEGTHTTNPTRVVNSAKNQVFLRGTDSGVNSDIYFNNTLEQNTDVYEYRYKRISKKKAYTNQRPYVVIDSDRNLHQFDSDVVDSFVWLTDYIVSFDSDLIKEKHDRKAADSDIIEKFKNDSQTITLVQGQTTYLVTDSEVNKNTTWNFLTKITSNGSTYFGTPEDHFEVSRTVNNQWQLVVDGVDSRSKISVTVTDAPVSTNLLTINISWNGTKSVSISPPATDTNSMIAEKLYNALLAIGVPGVKWTTGTNVVTYFADDGVVLPTTPQTPNGLTFTFTKTTGTDTGFYYKDGDTIYISEKW